VNRQGSGPSIGSIVMQVSGNQPDINDDGDGDPTSAALLLLGKTRGQRLWKPSLKVQEGAEVIKGGAEQG
jgi:hypothetical protein